MNAKERRAKYYQENKERLNAQMKEYRQRNAEKVREMQRRWREENEGHTYVSEYVKYIGFRHPACNPSGITGYHRIVLWDKLGGMDVECWNYDTCKTFLYWSKSYPESSDALIVDHIDGDKHNNDPDNLRASCQSCNRKYGYSTMSKYEGIKCSGPCDRQAITESPFGPVCHAHYIQCHRGYETLKEIRTRAFRTVDENHRHCKGCDEVKPNEDFYLTANKRTYRNECKECTKKRVLRNRNGGSPA